VGVRTWIGFRASTGRLYSLEVDPYMPVVLPETLYEQDDGWITDGADGRWPSLDNFLNSYVLRICDYRVDFGAPEEPLN
jgi:hypothetical protein